MAGKKQALGRGLEALFGEIDARVPVDGGTERSGAGPENIRVNADTDAAAPENMVLYIDIDEIKPNSMQPRQSFNPESIEELASSIEAYGVIQPVILAKAKTGYELVAGERRWRAARKAGLKTIPAIVRDVTHEETALIAIIENMQREDLNTIEEATAYKAVIKKFGMTQEGLSKAVGKSRPYIANTLRVLAMPPEIIELLRSGALTLGHANALGAVKDAEQQVALAEKAAKKGLSVRETERLSAALADGKPASKEPNEEIRRIEQELTSALGVKVAISGEGKKGTVRLKYFDRQDLEEIIELLRRAGAREK